MKIIVTIIPTDLVTNSLLSTFCPFLQTKNKNQVGGGSATWWSGNEKYFCVLFIASHIYFKAMPKSIDFYKGTFLHAIPVLIIVPCIF